MSNNTFWIGEIGVNHENNTSNAFRLISELASAGWSACKFQAYKADSLARQDSPAYWDTSKETATNQHELFSRYDLWGPEEYISMYKCCTDHAIEFMSSVFDADSLKYIDPLVKRHKISSSDITNYPLIRDIALTGKPIILSTGASTIPEIKRAIHWIRKISNCQITLLHCVLRYPTECKHASLDFIKQIQEISDISDLGYSDHTVPPHSDSAILASIALGGRTIEKHITYDKSLPGNDHYHSYTPIEAKNIKEKVDDLLLMLNCDNDHLLNQDLARTNARRAITAKHDLLAGTVLTEDNITTKRPLAHGICASLWPTIIGKTLACDVLADQALTNECIAA